MLTKAKAVTLRVYWPFNLYGTSESGNHGHEGRPGEVGGSAPSGVRQSTLDKDSQTAITTMGAIAERHADLAPQTWKIAPPDTATETTHDDPDYAKTRLMAERLVNERTVEILKERGLEPEGSPSALAEQIETEMWKAWKSGSQDPLGRALQMAVHEEMGVLPTARLVDGKVEPLHPEFQRQARYAASQAFLTDADRAALATKHSFNEKEWQAQRADVFKRVNPQAGIYDPERLAALKVVDKTFTAMQREAEEIGMARARAYVRAQWETNQYVMHKAGVTDVEVYRGVTLSNAEVRRGAASEKPATGDKLPNLKLVQNAAASTTTRRDVANHWDAAMFDPINTKRVVLRFHVPASSVVSVPVFGRNFFGESEVVMMGTKGLQWDAWLERAPEFATTPLSHRFDVPAALHLTEDGDDEDEDDPVLVDLWTPEHWLKREDTPIEPPAEEDDNGETETLPRRDLGGAGSGNFGHSGRPGEVGGSGGSATSIPAGQQGECFRNAGQFVRAHEQEGFRAVHGKITNGSGRTFDHAWAENDTEAADPTTGVRMDKMRWRELVQAQPEASYSAEELAINGLRTQHWGPWTTEEGAKPGRRTDLYGTSESGNYGHVGRPGQVGGSGPSAGGTGGVSLHPPTKEDAEWLNKNSALRPNEVEQMGDKPDGGKFIIQKVYHTPEYEQKMADRVTAVLRGEAEPAQIALEMMHGLHGDVRVAWAMGENPNYPDAEILDLIVTGDTPSSGRIKIGRQFIRHPDGTLTVHHDSFMVPKEEQGKGIAKTVLADSIEAYKKLGVTQVTTIANDERGAYAWAKFGFKTTDAPALAQKLTNRVTGAGRGLLSQVLPDATDAQKASIQAVIDAHKDDPRLPWHIAGIVTPDGQAVGKQLLWEIDWPGVLDMKDTEAMDRLHHYVSKP